MCGANTICMCPTQAVEYATYGGFAGGNLFGTKCLVLWGHGPSQSSLVVEYPAIAQAKKGGMKLIVVDPRRIREAEMADMWLPIRRSCVVSKRSRIIEQKCFAESCQNNSRTPRTERIASTLLIESVMSHRRMSTSSVVKRSAVSSQTTSRSILKEAYRTRNSIALVRCPREKRNGHICQIQKH